MNLFYVENGRAGSFPAVADSGPDDSINVVIAGAATATSTCSAGMAKGMDPKPSVVEASTMVKVKVRTRFNILVLFQAFNPKSKATIRGRP